MEELTCTRFYWLLILIGKSRHRYKVRLSFEREIESKDSPQKAK